jgi:4-hydroxy-tetrahydrodipicolinate synthase
MKKQSSKRIRGVFSPVVTPFKDNLAVDEDKFVEHCKWLIANGVSLAVFGTNSEANSLSMTERLYLTDTLIESGVDASRLMPGTGCCSIPETVKLTRHATENGAAGVLMLPPFYYKDLSEDGLFAYFSEIVQQVGSDDLRIYLYHIPQVTQVPITVSLIARLLKHYPNTFCGLKDSSGDWAGTQRIIESFAKDGFDVFPGSEMFMLDALRIGGAGCISATANVNPKAIVRLYENWKDETADTLNESVKSLRKVFQQYAILPAMKETIARYRQEPSWVNVRPPLIRIDELAASDLKTKLDQLEFEMTF